MSGLRNYLRTTLSRPTDYRKLPVGLNWRSNTIFIIATVGVGLFTDLFLYGLIVPILPFLLEDRIHAPLNQIQSLTSGLLAAFAGASVLFSPVAGIVADRTHSRRYPFLCGLFALLLATLLLYLGRNVETLVIARISQGISGGTVWVVGIVICLDTVGPENLGKTIGTIFSFISVAGLVGPVLGGILYEHAGFEGVFGVGAAFVVVDFVMRAVVIEKRVAERYKQNVPAPHPTPGSSSSYSDENGPQHEEHHVDGNVDGSDESTPLLGQDKQKFKIEPSSSRVLRKFPILCCFRDPGLSATLLISFIQAAILGGFDATVPTEAKLLFGFDSLEVGVLFIPLAIADLVIGPLAGWAVDKVGPKPVGTVGFGWLVPVLVALRAVNHDSREQVVLYCALLALSGTGLAIVGASSIVEAGSVVEKYHKANPGLFGENGPFAQLYGINGMFFSMGLTVGPVLAGSLREAIGYGNMNAVVAVICFLTSVACFTYLSGPPKQSARSST